MNRTQSPYHRNLALVGLCFSAFSCSQRTATGTQDTGSNNADASTDRAIISTDGPIDRDTIDVSVRPDVSVRDVSHVTDAAPTGTPPDLQPGVWTNITPAEVNLQPGCCTTYPNAGFNNNTFGVTWIVIDPNNPYVLYVAVDVQGIWKSTDGGATWNRLGTPLTAPNYATTIGYIDSPTDIRIDPDDSRHLYATQAVRGGTLGFWVSTDAGETWTTPPGFTQIAATTTNDVPHMAIDPSDFRHVLLSSHSPWGGATQTTAGIMETTDAGQTFVAHAAPSGWSGAGTFGVNFLYEPSLGIGDNHTWIAARPDVQGLWLSTNSGTAWTQISPYGALHGAGADIYFTAAGIGYMGSNNHILRTTDHGSTWTPVGPSTPDGYYHIIGDGNLLYTMSANTGTSTTGPAPFITSPETDGLTWTPYQNGTQTFTDGPYRMAFDPVHRILYSANWDAGLWALKVVP